MVVEQVCIEIIKFGFLSEITYYYRLNFIFNFILLSQLKHSHNIQFGKYPRFSRNSG